MSFPQGAAVDLEKERLQGIVSLVWESAHYDPVCSCEHCTQTREFLAPEDLEFVDHVANAVKGNGKPPELDDGV